MAVAIPSSSCSSEATGKAAGMAGLLYSAARNAGRRLTANEVRQLFTMTADDIDFLTAKPPAPAANFATEPVGREQTLPLDPRLRRVLRLRPGERGPHGARGGHREPPARGRDHRSRLVHDRLAGGRPARGAGPGGRTPRALLRLRGVGRAWDDQGPGLAGLRGAERVPARVGDAPALLELRAPPGTPGRPVLRLDRAPARGARQPAHRAGRSTSPPATATPTGSRSRSASGCATTTIASARTAAAPSCTRTPTRCPASRAASPPTARPPRGSRT